VKGKHYASIDELIEEMAGLSIEEVCRRAREEAEPGSNGLISREELMAAGALAWQSPRKKPGGRKSERDLFSDMTAEDEAIEKKEPESDESND
jgi:hypothetical protein